MGWNEPPGNNQGKDPWGKRGDGEGPPDLDELIKKMQRGLGGFFGKRPDSVGGGSPIPWAAVIIALIAWFVYDVSYAIDQQERGVVLRFGRYVTTMQPGLNFRFPRPIEKVITVNVGQVRPMTHRATMLTQDENIVDVDLAVKWQIKDPDKYLFQVHDPIATLRQATESAVREVIGKSKLDFVLTEGRSEIAQRQHEVVQTILDDYQAGILIVGVEMQSAKPPEEVKDAFDDAIKAREDEQRLVNEAEAYRNEITPKARGEAARIREEANAYKFRVIAKAEGQANRFEQQLAEYQRAPEITRQRLYLDAMENVLSNSSKVLIDTEGSSSLMYLPIDQLIKQKQRDSNSSSASDYTADQASETIRELRDRWGDRTRGIR